MVIVSFFAVTCLLDPFESVLRNLSMESIAWPTISAGASIVTPLISLHYSALAFLPLLSWFFS
jgi:hypothetical protein